MEHWIETSKETEIFYFFFYYSVTLEGQDATTLQLKVHVVDRCLELLDPKTGENIQRMPFGSTYYGTDKTRLAYLYNNGPAAINFVTVLEENALGTEAVSLD